MASDRILPIRRLLKSLPSYLLIPACRDELHRCPDLNQIFLPEPLTIQLVFLPENIFRSEFHLKYHIYQPEV